MWLLVFTPFLAQAIAIGFDELYFHHSRGLPKWERIGHPLDTLSLFVCLLMTAYAPFTSHNIYFYIGLSVFSCLMVTKDEFVHKEHCPGAENWLHALLFILHPITLFMAGLMWAVVQEAEVPGWLVAWLGSNVPELKSFLFFQTYAVLFFAIYQIIFWNFIWKNKPVIKH
jgi:hypothetical protein